jgi:hypothetical protein
MRTLKPLYSGHGPVRQVGEAGVGESRSAKRQEGKGRREAFRLFARRL